MPDFADQLIVHTLLMAMFRLTDEQKQVMLAMNHVLSELSNLRPGQTFPPESLETFEKTKLVIQDLIQKRHDNPGDDFISQLIMAREQDDALTELELFDQVFMVCIAALSTTPSTMGGMLLTLMRHPDQLAVLRADMDRVTDAMDECLRYHTHRFIGGFTRFPVEEVVLGGTVVPKNTPVHLSLQAGHFDPDQFPDPLRFDIDRKPKGLLAFGIGVHNCMGARLARMVLRVALRRFLERFPNVRLADPNLVPVYGGGTGERRIAHMPMRTH
jgi:cytochrome P450